MRALILIFLLSSCSFSRIKEEPPQVEVSEAPVETISEQGAQPLFEQPLSTRSGKLAAGDVLNVSVMGEEELEGSAAIAPDGRLYYAFLEGIAASGKSVAEVKRDLESALSRYLIHPQVAITPLRVIGTQELEPSLASHTEYSEGSNPIAIEVSYFPSDEEIAYKIFEQTKQTIKAQDGMRDLYRLRIDDQLALAVYGEPSTQRQATIDKTGEIHFLYLNPIEAKGKTIPELREELQEHLKSHYQYPVVLVTFTNQ